MGLCFLPYLGAILSALRWGYTFCFASGLQALPRNGAVVPILLHETVKLTIPKASK
jgi:hypothetical protein